METSSSAVPFLIPGTEQWSFVSCKAKEYRIMVWIPDIPEPAAGFPVVYMLDANAAFGSMVEAVRLLSRGPYKIEPAIIVGIGYETDEPLDTKRRFYDFTIHADPEELPPRKDTSPWPETGGADEFLEFIERELKPVIERLHPVDRSRQTLFGHSLGGWFVMYVFFKRPQAFTVYAAGSPSIWWKNNYILSLAELLTPAMPESAAIISVIEKIQPKVYIGVGSLEKPHMLEGARRMFELLSAAAVPGLHLKHCCLQEEDHLSVIQPLLGRILRYALTN